MTGKRWPSVLRFAGLIAACVVLHGCASTKDEHAEAVRLSTAHHEQGNALLDAGRYSEASTQFRQALALAPKPSTHTQLGVTLTLSGESQEGLAHFQKALDGGDRSHYARYSYAIAALQAKQTPLAQQLLEGVFEEDPAYPHAGQTLGALYFDQGLFERATNVYITALQHLPDSEELHNNLGNAWRSLAQFDQALAALTQAVTLNPRYPEAWRNLALLHLDLKQHAKAVEASQQGALLDATNIQAWRLAVWVAHQAGDLPSRNAALQRLAALSPEAAQAMKRKRYQWD